MTARISVPQFHAVGDVDVVIRPMSRRLALGTGGGVVQSGGVGGSLNRTLARSAETSSESDCPTSRREQSGILPVPMRDGVRIDQIAGSWRPVWLGILKLTRCSENNREHNRLIRLCGHRSAEDRDDSLHASTSTYEAETESSEALRR